METRVASPDLEPGKRRMTAERMIGYAALVCLFALIFVSRITLITDHDVFMHLRTGEWIVENHAVPRADAFSYSAPGAEWDDHEWLFQLVAYLVHRMGGFVALGLMRAAVLTAALLLLYRICRLRGAPAMLAGALTLFAALGVWPFNEPRPYIITMLGLPLFGLALEHIRQGSRRWILVPPLFMLPWVNMHAGFTSGCILLLLVFGGVVVEELIGAMRRRKLAKEPRRRATRTALSLSGLLNRHDFRLLACGLLTFLAVLCNPYGWTILLFPFKLVGHEVLMQVIREWNPSVLAVDSAPFYGLALALALRAFWVARRARVADLAAVVVFTLMALGARRHVSLFFFVLIPVAAEWYASLLPQRARVRMPLQALGWAAILAAGFFCIVPTLKASRVWRFGFGYNEDIFPRRAVDLVEEYKLKPNVFNGYNFGGYLIYRLYPQYKVFIDGRADVYGTEINERFAQLLYAQPGWEAELDRMGANVVLMDAPLTDRKNLIDALVESPDWVLIYWDDAASLFVRRIPEHQKVIAERGFPRIHPLKTDEQLLRLWPTPADQADGLRELERRAGEQPPACNVLRNLSFLYGRRGENEKALTVVEGYLRLMPRDSSMIVRKGQLCEQLGRNAEAAKAYHEALRVDSGYSYPWTRLGVMAQARSDWREAEACYARAYRAAKPDSVGTLQYARALVHRKAWAQAAAVLRDYTRQRPSDKEAWDLLSLCYENTNQPFRAQQSKSKSLTDSR